MPEILMQDMLGKPLYMWGVFFAAILFLVALDLGVLHKGKRELGVKESLRMSAFYISAGLLFGGWLWFTSGAQAGEEYFAGFLIEKSLSLDNIFVISLVFRFFGVPDKYQHRVLFWGILGVLILRGTMIGLGVALISEFGWILHIFAAFLIYTGIKMLVTDNDEVPDVSQNPALKFLKKILHITDNLHDEKFFVRAPHPKTGKLILWATPLFAALCLVEIVDIIFAVDSVPAIFAITLDPYVIYTSNVFAILGLRALYFALAAILHRFEYLEQALAAVLIFIGAKVLAADFLGIEKVPSSISLGVTVALLGGGILYSMYKTRDGQTGEKAD